MSNKDFNLKQRIIRSELIYKVTAGPDGTRLLHLMSTPGSKFSFGHGVGGTIGLAGSKVWYHYYDTTAENIDQCRAANKDIIKLPSDVDTEALSWDKLNKPSQNWVRKYLIAYSKEGLARIWGKFSGELQVPDSTVKLDYNSLLTEAKDEKSKLVEELMQRLERLRPDKMLERKANEAENLNKGLKFRAMPSSIIVI